MLNREFPNQYYGSATYKHNELPIIATEQFNFFRCIPFNESMYGKTISELQFGNLRLVTESNRYSTLFKGQKVSYWADSIETAKAEYRDKGQERIEFWAYDDMSSTFPTIEEDRFLYIIDGTKFGFDNILEKVDNTLKLTQEEKNLILQIEEENPDGLAYKSHKKVGGINFLFFEKGFKKLSLREVVFRVKIDGKSKKQTINCACSSDFSPDINSYGKYLDCDFKVKVDDTYLQSEEYKSRKSIYEKSIRNITRR